VSEPADLLNTIDGNKAALRALDRLKSDGISARPLSIAYTKLQESLMWLNKFRFQEINELPERHNL
jgi:hypothetical protein